MTWEICNNEISEKHRTNLSGILQSSSPPFNTNYFNSLFTLIFYNFIITFSRDLLGCFFPTLSLTLYLQVILGLTSGSSARPPSLRCFISKIYKYEHSVKRLSSCIWKGQLWGNATKTKHTRYTERYLCLLGRNKIKEKNQKQSNNKKTTSKSPKPTPQKTQSKTKPATTKKSKSMC